MRPLDASDPRVIGPYQVLGLLGGGGMGRVYLGQSRTGRRLAIKVVRTHLAEDPVFRQRFAREVAAARLVSPLFTAAVVDADPNAPEPWLATTFIDGISLEQHVEEQGPLSTGEVLTLTAGLAEALSSIHRVGLVHRDLKPSNVLLDEAGPHIIDFGLALAATATRMTTSLVVGTPSYMAPERLSGGEAGPPSDIFSLGATLVFATTGRDLVDDASVYEQILQIGEGRFDLSDVPAELRPLIIRCISPKPRDRPTAEELTRIVVALGVSLPVPVIALPRHRVSQPTGVAPDPVIARRIKPPAILKPPAVEPIPAGRRSRRAVLAFGGSVAIVIVGGGVAAATGLLGWRRASGTLPVWQTVTDPGLLAPTGPVRPSAGVIIWKARSGSGAGGPGPSVSDQRIVVNQQRQIVTTNGPEVFAIDSTGILVWSKTMPADLTGMWLWGDAVLVTDSRRLWLLDATSGSQRFATDPVKDEIAASQTDNPNHIPVAVGQIAVSADRAFINLGTAIIAIGGDGKQQWRMMRSAVTSPPQTAGGPVAADAQSFITQDVAGSAATVGRYDAGSGAQRWTAGYALEATAPPGPGPAPGPGGGPPPDDAWQRSEARLDSTHVVVRSGQEIRVLDLATGQIKWKLPSSTPVTAIEIVDRLLLVAADRITAYELANGAFAWQSPQHGARLAVCTEPHVIVTATDQGISALDTAGNVLWQTPLPDSVLGLPVDALIAGQHVAFLTFNSPPDQSAQPRIDVLAIALDALA